jgi:hypothetical protein
VNASTRGGRPGLVNGWVLVVAALVASPVWHLLSEGLLSVEEAMTRYLLVALATVAAWAGVRRLWPVAGEPSPSAAPVEDAAAGAGETGAPLEDAV